MRHTMKGEAPHTAGYAGTRPGERGSALVIALLVVVILALLGLSFMLAGETESKIARNQRDAAQAGFVAEGGVRMVKKWFDAPTGANAHLVPTTAQMDRTLRWVDDDGDGTYVAYASATDPTYRVMYREGTNDPFEKPYRGTPALTLLGNEDHPDIRISDATSAQQTFLNNLNAGLYPSFPDPTGSQTARIRQIDVYGPPILTVGGQRTRYGIGTVKVIADIYQYMGTAQQTRIATRIVKAVLNEAPYLGGPGGPLQSCSNIDTNGDFAVHWGNTTSVTTLNLHANLDQKVTSGVPSKPNSYSYILPDMNGDGTLQTSTSASTPDDQNHNGILDFNDWLASANVEDPWLRFMSEGNVLSGGNEIGPASSPTAYPGCSTTDCQPVPFYNNQNGINHVGTGTDDHSNIFKNVSKSLCPTYDYAFWKNVALAGGENIYYYKPVGGGNFRLLGQGPNVTFTQAVDGKTGLFFFDTTDSAAPHDAAGQPVPPFVNLTPDVSLSGGGLTTGGFIYLNANFHTSGSGNTTTQRELIAPGEPFIDANANNRYDPDEWFIDITYPGSVGGGYVKNGAHRVVDGFVRQEPATDTGTAGRWNADINVYGVFIISGTYDAQGNWIFFGTVVTRSGMTGGVSGTPDFYWDERLVKNQWPPISLNLPRTVITAWQTDL